ncbi:ABC transporter permease [Streptomyces sp. NBC_01431]|uniref:ABC transporter permease n=1 Tax=Streptomyces sp. NBC_01431 TaxID=2903863 RepID=UPI002E35B84E|nr:ABC transporter permease [Streptomyces sp. NBC_01431]
MSTLASAAPPVALPVDEPRARFRDLLLGEWFKLWSLRSMRWGFVLGLVALMVLNFNAAIADVNDWAHFPADMRAHYVPGGSLAKSFTNNACIATLLIAGSLGAVSLVSEYSTGLIRTSFAAVPARRALLAAKMLVLTTVLTGFGLVATAVSFWVTQAVLSSKHAGISLAEPGIWRALLASVLLPPVCGLVGLGLASLIRHSAATIVATMSVLLLIPNFLSENHYWSACLFHATPFRAWQGLHDLIGAPVNPHIPFPAQTDGEWWVYLGWALAGALVTFLVGGSRRDV